MTSKPACNKQVEVKGGSCLASVRNCSCKTVYVDAMGRGWCKRHEPDTETKERWAALVEARNVPR